MMRILIVFAGMFFLMVSCHNSINEEDGETVYPLFAIDLQTGFENDAVMVKVDNEIVFYNTIRTNYSTGIAKRLTPKVKTGIHTVKVRVDNFSVESDTTIVANDTLVVGVNFNRQSGQLSFRVYSFWLMYR